MGAALKFINPYKPHIGPQSILNAKAYDIDEYFETNASGAHQSAHVVTLPISAEKVACGLFGIHDDYIEKFQSLDSRFIKNKASTFFFEASSNSMEPLIFEGDTLIVDRSVDAVHGKVAVLALNGEMICKRIIRSGANITLHSDNPAFKPIKVTEEMDLTIFGVVTGIAREI